MSDKRTFLMNELSTNINSKHQEKISEAKIGNASGRPVYEACVTIFDKSDLLKVEIHKSKSILEKEFPNTSQGIQEMIVLFRFESVKGVRLDGRKKECYILSDILVRKGLKPLITTHKEQNPLDKHLKGIPVINHNVAGIDIGKSLIVVAVPPHLADNHTQAFGTFTQDLEEIVSLLVSLGITEVAMESTSVYWMPLRDLLEEHKIKAIIVNPRNVKMIPGRKTDVLDAQWLMRLLACGMLTGGFIPESNMRSLRDLSRFRSDLIERAGDNLNRMHKLLSLMNIQLSLVLSDISGKSATAIIKAIIGGERNPAKLADLVEVGCKCSLEDMMKALHGKYSDEYIFMLKEEQEMHEYHHKIIVKTELEIKKKLDALPDVVDLSKIETSSKRQRKKTEYNRSPYCFDLRTLLYRKFGYDLTTISGIDSPSAAIAIFETGGGKMDAFPTEKHFSSWSAVAPGNKISGGKVLSGKAPKKFSRVGQVFRAAANSNYKSETAVGARLRRFIRNGKSKKSARKASAHQICIMTYRMMRYGQAYVDKGAEAYEKAYEEKKINACLKVLETHGYDCSKIRKNAS